MADLLECVGAILWLFLALIQELYDKLKKEVGDG